MRRFAFTFPLLLLLLGASAAVKVTEGEVRQALAIPGDQLRLDRLKALGPAVLPYMARIYGTATPSERLQIANSFYALGWKSREAKVALMKDLGTKDESLRPVVQYALGRVSDDEDVVEALAGVMRNDPNELFRDKAACALAYDQIHLTEKQKVALFAKLIDGLSDEKPQVRAISIQALRIHTGQIKGFHVFAKPEERSKAIEVWKRWLAEYQRNL